MIETADARVMWTQTGNDWFCWAQNITLKEAKKLARRIAKELPAKTKVEFYNIETRTWELKAEY